MILAKLRGGLSNQMFQYAAAKSLAHVHGTSVLIDNSWYEKIPEGATPRRYELDCFSMNGTMATHFDLIGTNGIRNTPAKDQPVALWRKIFPKWKFEEEKHFHFDPDFFNLPDQSCLFGYWISEKYFLPISNLIRKEFVFRHPPNESNAKTIAEIHSVESVAIHVRRGDYLKNPEYLKIHGVLPIEYYLKAIAQITSQITQPHFFVFSDDLVWAEENLKFDFPVTFITNNQKENNWEDLRLMSLCKHQIIANSGFSWWGAWLNENKTKQIIAPRRWFNTDKNNTKDLTPEPWIIL